MGKILTVVEAAQLCNIYSHLAHPRPHHDPARDERHHKCYRTRDFEGREGVRQPLDAVDVIEVGKNDEDGCGDLRDSHVEQGVSVTATGVHGAPSRRAGEDVVYDELGLGG